MKKIFLIKKLWATNCPSFLTNGEYYGYTTFAFVKTKEEADEVVAQGKIFPARYCREFHHDMPQFEYEELKQFDEALKIHNEIEANIKAEEKKNKK